VSCEDGGGGEGGGGLTIQFWEEEEAAWENHRAPAEHPWGKYNKINCLLKSFCLDNLQIIIRKEDRI